MKKVMVFVLALSLALSAMLAGCGEMRGRDDRTTAPTATPKQTIVPDTTTPDPQDGIVRDDDGIITESDSGGAAGNTPEAPANSARPDTGTSGTNSGTAASGNALSAKR